MDPRFTRFVAARLSVRAYAPHPARVGFVALLLAINALIAARLSAAPEALSFFHYLEESLRLLSGRDVQLWLVANGALIGCYFLACWRYAGPLRQLQLLMAQTSGALGSPALPAPRGLPSMLAEMTTLATQVKEQARQRHELAHMLEQTRQVLAQCEWQQQTMMRTAHREMLLQYQSVLGYANYLDEHIQRRTADETLRFDFDDVCESSFALKLIAGALDRLGQPEEVKQDAVLLGGLLQQTLIALAPSLDRRAMALTTEAVDETTLARTDAAMLTHVVWMMLFGLIRYAEVESRLAIRTESTSEGRSQLAITVNALAPGAMTEAERAAHLVRQMQHGNAPMFAETIRIHAHIQLAELLLTRLDASIAVVPLSAYACEIVVDLPSA